MLGPGGALSPIYEPIFLNIELGRGWGPGGGAGGFLSHTCM